MFVPHPNREMRGNELHDPFRPVEIAELVPPAPAKLMDYRPNRPLVGDTTDVFVDENGLIYCTDSNAGLYIMEMENL